MKFSSLLLLITPLSLSLASSLPTRSTSKCFHPSPHEIDSFITRTLAFWSRQGGDKNIPTLAEKVYTKDVEFYSNSISSSRGFKISPKPVYANRAEWVADFRTLPRVGNPVLLSSYATDCDTLVLLLQLRDVKGSPGNVPVNTIEIHTLERKKGDGVRSKEVRVEFDAVAWGRALGGEYRAPKREGEGEAERY